VSADILETPRYYPAEVARLVDLSVGRVRRYLRGYSFPREVHDGTADVAHRPPVTRLREDAADPYASFLDLVDLTVVKEFLCRGFTLWQVRRFIDEVRRTTGCRHIASNRFFTLDQNAFLEVLSATGQVMIALGQGGQTALFKAVELHAVTIDFEELSGRALRWYPAGRSEPVVVDPKVMYGRPSITEAHIPTDVVHSLYKGEGGDVGAVAAWYNISQRQAEAAVAFEESLARRHAA
jgi:uncharacterized protein (DUF433 family)